jgi:hypothetical protein
MSLTERITKWLDWCASTQPNSCSYYALESHLTVEGALWTKEDILVILRYLYDYRPGKRGIIARVLNAEHPVEARSEWFFKDLLGGIV